MCPFYFKTVLLLLLLILFWYFILFICILFKTIYFELHMVYNILHGGNMLESI